MIKELISVMKIEEESLNHLLSLLDRQYTLIMKKEVFQLETLVEEITEANRVLAQSEVNRRKVLGKESLKEIVEGSSNQELDNIYRRIQRKVLELVQQKDTNELLIRQQMSLNNVMLNILNPTREMKTYNSYGNLSR